MSVRLREGDEGDIDILMDVMAAAFDPAFGEAWTAGQCLGILSLPDVWLSFAEDGDEPGEPTPRALGFALSRLLLDDAELLLLAVHPEARQRGLGRALIDRTAEIAAGKGGRRLLLEVRDDNPAIALYRLTGFAEIGRRRAYYRGPDGTTRDALTLARALGQEDG